MRFPSFWYEYHCKWSSPLITLSPFPILKVWYLTTLSLILALYFVISIRRSDTFLY